METIKEKPNRLLLTMEYLWEKTDEDHPASVRDIAAHLEKNGLTATRKTIYHDVAQLRAAGADIDCRNENQNLYYIDRRVFELPEVKLLVDAVQSARFISPRKSKALIKRLSAFVSEHQADVLKRQLYIDSRAKSPNDSIFYMVDALYSAIQQRQKVTFQYFEYNQKKERVLKHNGRVYVFSPYALLWNEDCYYTISDIAEQDQQLSELNSLGLADPDFYISQKNELAEQRQAKLEKERLVSAKDDDSIKETKRLIEALEDRPAYLAEFDDGLFEELVTAIIIEDNTHLRFQLRNGLELQEAIERTMR